MELCEVLADEAAVGVRGVMAALRAVHRHIALARVNEAKDAVADRSRDLAPLATESGGIERSNAAFPASRSRCATDSSRRLRAVVSCLFAGLAR